MKTETDEGVLEKDVGGPLGPVLRGALEGAGWVHSIQPGGGILLQPRGKPFPSAGIDVVESVFDADIEFIRGPLTGQKLHLANMVDKKQSVARSRSFFRRDASRQGRSLFALPEFFKLPESVRRPDFPIIPEG